MTTNTPSPSYANKNLTNNQGGTDCPMERLPRHVEQLLEKNIAAEFSFNRRYLCAKNDRIGYVKLRRIKSEKYCKADKPWNSNENVTFHDLTKSMPERMMKLSVNFAPSGNVLNMSGNSSTNLKRSYEIGLHKTGPISPALIRSRTFQGQQSRSDQRTENPNAKLAMMKKKLSPLPDRHLIKSFEEISCRIRDPSPDTNEAFLRGNFLPSQHLYNPD